MHFLHASRALFPTPFFPLTIFSLRHNTYFSLLIFVAPKQQLEVERVMSGSSRGAQARMATTQRSQSRAATQVQSRARGRAGRRLADARAAEVRMWKPLLPPRARPAVDVGVQCRRPLLSAMPALAPSRRRRAAMPGEESEEPSQSYSIVEGSPMLRDVATQAVLPWAVEQPWALRRQARESGYDALLLEYPVSMAAAAAHPDCDAEEAVADSSVSSVRCAGCLAEGHVPSAAFCHRCGLPLGGGADALQEAPRESPAVTARVSSATPTRTSAASFAASASEVRSQRSSAELLLRCSTSTDAPFAPAAAAPVLRGAGACRRPSSNGNGTSARPFGFGSDAPRFGQHSPIRQRSCGKSGSLSRAPSLLSDVYSGLRYDGAAVDTAGRTVPTAQRPSLAVMPSGTNAAAFRPEAGVSTGSLMNPPWIRQHHRPAPQISRRMDPEEPPKGRPPPTEPRAPQHRAPPQMPRRLDSDLPRRPGAVDGLPKGRVAPQEPRVLASSHASSSTLHSMSGHRPPPSLPPRSHGAAQPGQSSGNALSGRLGTGGITQPPAYRAPPQLGTGFAGGLASTGSIAHLGQDHGMNQTAPYVDWRVRMLDSPAVRTFLHRAQQVLMQQVSAKPHLPPSVIVLVEIHAKQRGCSLSHDMERYQHAYNRIVEAVGDAIASPDDTSGAEVTALVARAPQAQRTTLRPALNSYLTTSAAVGLPTNLAYTGAPESRIGAFEVYLITAFPSDGSLHVPRVAGLHSKLWTRRFPNANNIVRHCQAVLAPVFRRYEADGRMRTAMEAIAAEAARGCIVDEALVGALIHENEADASPACLESAYEMLRESRRLADPDLEDNT